MNATYIEIKQYLEAHKHDDSDQFCIDWIEKTLDGWKYREIDDEKNDELTLDDETMRGAVHYETQNIPDVLKADAQCRPFFEGLERLTTTHRPFLTSKRQNYRLLFV